ncbi:MAG: hypothetical protein IH597_13440, partial [Bacteroidales bacterium]|nr:hypothetical protein [Bacteroidales bacterium]
FFGDICILNPEAYEGSIYAQGGIMVDEVAVMRVIVKRNNVEVPNSPFDNISIYGTGQVLCVQYPDYLRMADVFTFELQVWVPTTTPGVFDWQTYATYTTNDGTPLTQIGAQGIVDFAIGTCSPMSTNIYSWLDPPQGPGQGGIVDWDAFNDCVGPASGSAPNTTIFSGYLGGGGGFETPSGLLKDFATGNNTTVTVTMAAVNVSGSLGSMPDAGTDAHTTFNGILNLNESASYNSSSFDWSYKATFTGLDPSKIYEFTATVNRNGITYAGTGAGSRWSRFTIAGADSYTNASSSGSGVIAVSQAVIKINGGFNTTEGNVVKWTGIQSGADGTFEVISENVGAEGPGDPKKSYGMQGFKLTQLTP